MKNQPSSKIATAKLLALLLLAPLALSPLSRAQMVNSTTVITDTDSTVSGGLGPLSGVTFNGVSGTVEVASGYNLVYDSASGTSNRLTVTTGNAANFLVDASSTLTFSGNKLAAGNGAAMNFASGASHSFIAADDSLIVFDSNTAAAGNGGAIYNNGGSAKFTFNNVAFKNNYAGGGNATGSQSGGAVFFNTGAGSTISFTNALFASNTAVGSGGAIYNGTGSTLTVTSATFQNNYASITTVNANAGGGAFYTFAPNNSTTHITFNDVLFKGNNTNSNGGAVLFQTPSTVTSIAGDFTNVMFQSNTAGVSGGAFTANNAGGDILNFTNVSFLDNHAGTSGGALLVGGTVNFIVNASTSATMAGNTAGAGSGTSNGIYVANTGSTANVITFNIGNDAQYYMLDPIQTGIAASSSISVIKTGSGVWNLGGQNNLSQNNTVAPPYALFSVNQGTLHLYREGETGPANPTGYTAHTGNITVSSNFTSGSFFLAAPATLSAGGGNTITAPVITLAANSTLAFDMAFFTNPDNATASILTLSANTFNVANWTQNISLLNLDSLPHAGDATYNLLQLAGTGASTNIFTDANLANLLCSGLTSDYKFGYNADGTILQLLYTYTAPGGNRVLLWTGGDIGNTWAGNNWLVAGDGAGGTATAFKPGDVVNLVDTPPPTPDSGTITVTAAVTVAGMYASGNQNYTIAGAGGITASATASDITGDAASGKLILGARASDNGATVDTSAASDFTGTLTLANGANNFQGGIDINTGVLVGNAARLGSGTGGVNIAASGTLVFDQAAAATYSATIAGQGAIIKTNTGALTIAADNSAFAGTTDINAGSLLIASAAAHGGSINVNATGLLGGAGSASTVGSTVTVNSGGVLQVGNPSATGASPSLSILGNLTLNDGSLLDYTNVDNTLLVGGAVSLFGSGTINLGSVALGSFALIGAGDPLTLDPSQFTLYYNGSLFDTIHYNWDTAALSTGTLWLDILSTPLAANNVLTWANATGDAAWLGSENWTLTGIGGNAPFSQGDIVNLDGATSGSIALADSATASAIYVSGNASYAVTGTGALATATGVGVLSGTAVNGKLVLGKTAADAATTPAITAFTGTLDLTGITGTNNFTQGVEINSGALRVSTTDQLGTTLSKLTFTSPVGAANPATLIAAGDMNFNSNSGVTNRLTLTASTAATFVIEDGVTLTFSNNVASAQGGAINAAAAGVNLTFKTGAGAQLVFDNNKNSASSNDGGAISIISGTLTIDATNGSFLFTNNNGGNRGAAIFGNTSSILLTSGTFKGNYTTSNGGAVAALTNTIVNATNVMFVTNTGGGAGGALFGNTGEQMLVQSSTFLNNVATGAGGGAIGIQNGAVTAPAVQPIASLTLRDVTFSGNYATALGGAIMLQSAYSIVDAARTTFASNTAGTNGGAVDIANSTNSGTFTDDIFTNNIASGNGGAIFIAGGTLAINVSDGGNSLFAGNKAGASATPNSIYFNGAVSATVNIGAGGHLDMLDPMSAANAATTITQTGPGTWNLGGNNTLGTTTAAAINFTISNGATLHLYRAGEHDTSGAYTVAPAGAGSINIAGGSFNLNSGATLSAGGGNTIAAPAINLAGDSTITIDLFGAAANTSASLLTLNATTLNAANWTQTLNLLNLGTLDLANNDTFNLITLTGAGAASSLFDATSFGNLTGATGLTGDFSLQLADGGATLQLLYYNASLVNHVLAWSGATGSSWRGANWVLSSDPATAATYARGDIVNLADTAALATTAINVDATPGATVAGMNVSGAASYTITGNSITTSATAGSTLTGGAVTGQLILGANATDDGAGGATLADAPFTGTLTLANTSNTFENGIDIRSGALVGNAANLGVGAGQGIAIAPAGSLTFSQTNNATTSVLINGSGALNKTGAGALTLAADNSSFAGTTNINAGSLLLPAASALGGNIHVNSAATLAGATGATAGTLGSTVAVHDGGILKIGLDATPAQTFTILGNLALDAGSLLNYSSYDDTLLVGGNVSLAGASLATPVTINLLAGTMLIGSYTLIDATGGFSTGFDSSLLTVNYKGTLLDPGADYTFTTDGGLLLLNVLNVPIAGNTVLTWNGAANDGRWLASANWLVNGVGVTKAFAQADVVNLAGATSAATPAGAPETITLETTATVAGMYLSGATSYAIAGAGNIIADATIGDLSGSAAATGKLILGANAPDAATAPAYTAFTGTLDLSGLAGANNFTAGVEINSGALRIATAAQLGAPLSQLTFTSAAGAGKLIGAAGSDIIFDGAGGAANRLTVATGQSVNFMLEDSATMTFANNALTGNGGLMSASSAAAQNFTAAPTAQFLFTSNTANTGNGGVIYNSGAGATFTLNNVIFRDNYAGGAATNATQNGGGVFYNGGANATFNITNALFQSNTSAIDGGVFANSGAVGVTFAVTSATFLNNTSLVSSANNAGGGVYYNSANSGTIIFTDVLFQGNYAVSNGGAIKLQHPTNTNVITGIFTNVLFLSNSAGAAGGAYDSYNANTGDMITFTNVSFINNYAGSNGGALALSGTDIFHVTTSATMAGNVAGSGLGNGIYVYNNANSPYLTFDIDAGAHFDQLDPIYASGVNQNQTAVVTKTGAGVWNLGGSNSFVPNNATPSGVTTVFAVNQGTLHLYRAGETSGDYAAAAGSITIASNINSGTFTLASGATLSAGGGNSITAPVINLDAGSTIELDLLGYSTSTPILTLNATTTLNGNGWSQTISLLNPSALPAAAQGDTFNLITLGNSKTFDTADYFTLLNAPAANGNLFYQLVLDSSKSILQLYYGASLTTNNILNLAAAADTTWNTAGWLLAADNATPATYTKNDIVNLAGTSLAAPATITIDVPAAVVAGLNISGDGDYTITGNPIIANPVGGSFTGDAAATGQLVLGAIARADGSGLDDAPYTGTLILANASNNFQNGIDIRSGALVGNAANLAVGPGAGITIAPAGSLTFDQTTDAGDAAYAAPIAGAGTLNKTGAAALTLAADSSAFTGITNINAGALLLAPATPAALGGTIHVNDTATLGGANGATAGSAGATVSIASGAILQVGIGSTPAQTFSILGDLALDAGSSLNYTANTNHLLVGGNLTLAGASLETPVTISLLGAGLTTGTYTLIDAASGLASLNASFLDVSYRGTLLDPSTDYLFSTDNNLLLLTILNVPIVGNNVLTWNGAAADNLWLSSANWTTQGVTKPFVQGDAINLADIAPDASDPTSVPPASVAITLDAPATVAGISVSGTTNYAIAGAGAITADPAFGDLAGGPAATGKLTLGAFTPDDGSAPAYTAFTGTLDLTAQTGANNFVNGVEINSGALRVATTDQLGAPLSKLNFTGAGSLIAAGDLNFDGAGAAANRLTVPVGGDATFVLEDGVSLTIANNNSGASGAAANVNGNLTIKAGAGSQITFANNTTGGTGDGGAMAVNSGANLTIDASAPGAGFLFANNNTQNRGGAIFAQTGNVTLLSGTFSGNYNNTGNGAAVAGIQGSTLTITDVVFVSNTANISGALFNNTNSVTTVNSSTFLYNTATANGGATAVQGTSVMTMNNVAYIGNTAFGNGGAIMMQTTSTLFVTNGLFQGNSAGNAGGVIHTDASWVDLTNVSFLDNTSGTVGGILNMVGAGILNLNVTTSATIAGNTANGLSNSLNFANNTSTGTLTVTVGAGAHLDMLDPMSISSTTNGAVIVNKYGAGTWNLGGNNILNNNAAANTGNITINAGALHLYRTGETSGAYTAQTGNLTLGNYSSFMLGSGATLSAGGGNTITAGAINLMPNSTIALDMSAATNNSSVLTLNSANFVVNNWTQNLNLLNLLDLEAANNDVFNLITIGGDDAANNLFTNASFNNLAGITGITAGYTLQISDDGSTLQLAYYNADLVNNVITWNGATDANWRGANWLLASDHVTGTTYAKGDIVNLAGITGVASSTININSAAGAVVAGMNISGTESYTLVGTSLTTTSTVGTLAGAPAATGKLILGAIAPDAATAPIAATFTGTLTLANTAGSGTNNFENGIDIHSGALVGNADTLHTGPGAGVSIDAAGSLTFNQTTNATYASPITGAGSLVMGASSSQITLTLTANSGAFAGTTDINAGALLLAGAASGSAGILPATAASLGGNINVAPGATLGLGNGATAGSGNATVAIAPGATLQIGSGADASQKFNILGNLTIGDGSLLDYTSLTNQLLVGGNTTILGSGAINLAGAITTGSFSLINSTGGITGFDASLFDVSYKGNVLDADQYTLATSGNQLWLTFATLPNNVLTYTNAAGDGLWLTSSNWQVNGGNVTKTFKQGDIVDLSGDGRTATTQTTATIRVSLADSATAAAIYVSGTSSYSVSGSGSLTTDASVGILSGAAAATGQLVLGKTAADPDTVNTAVFSGVFSLTGITGSNNFTGGIEIDSGVLRVSNNDQFGTTLSNLTFNSTLLGSSTSILVTSSDTYVDPDLGQVTDVTTVPVVNSNYALAAVRASGDLTFDGRGSAINRLVISASNNAAFMLDDGVTLTISNNNSSGAAGAAISIGNRTTFSITGGPNSKTIFDANTTGGSSDGGAISLTGTGSLLVLGGTLSTDGTTYLADGSSYLFTGNSSQNRGGAIFGQTTTIVAFNATFQGNHTATGNGGAIGVLQKSTVTLTNVLFDSNTTGGVGGAIFNNTNSVTTITSATFSNNTSTGGGGGALAVNGTSAMTVNDALFTGNRASSTATGASGNGGAIILQTNGSALYITDALFTGNSASDTAAGGTNNNGNGGAIAVMNSNNVVITDASFLNNTAAGSGTGAGSHGNGGAIYIGGSNATLFYAASAGNSLILAGNTANTLPNSIYIDAVHNIGITLDAAAGATINMLDPLASAPGAWATISKTGDGTLNLGGNTTFGDAATLATAIDFNVFVGTLHLDCAGETVTGPDGSDYTATTGNLTLNGASTFTISRGGNLSAGGGNTINATGIVIDPAATFTLDLLGAAPNNPASTVLTLNAGILLDPGAWTQTLDLLDVDTLTPGSDGATYNLITLTGNGAIPGYYPILDPGIFTSATTFTLAADLPDEYSLQLTPDNKTLQILYTAPVLANSVLTWNAASGSWLGANWNAASVSSTFNRGDIINIAGLTAAAATINVDTLTATATVAAMYVSGSGNTTITGKPIVANGNATLLAGDDAATGKLVLGAKASDDASTIDAAAYTGTLTLSNSWNNFTGGIEVNSGALVGNDKTLGAGDAGIAIGAAGSLTFNQTASGTYSSSITGDGALAKTGAATLTLTNDNSSFTGTTTVASGALLLGPAASADPAACDTAALGGAIRVLASATFGGACSAGDVTLASNATLQVGLAGAADSGSQVFNVSSLSLANNSILNYTALGNQLQVADPAAGITLAGAPAINITDFWTSGSYNLGNLAALNGAAQVTIDGAAQYTDARKQATLSADGNDLLLTTTRDSSRTLTWTGALNSTWALTGADWKTDDGSATNVFGAGDTVIFDDTAAAVTATNITIAASGALVSDMIVDSAANYAFTGGGITADASSAYDNAALADDATGKLTKDGAGSLTLNTTTGTNNFLGGIDLAEGSLVLGGTTTAGALVNVAADTTLQMSNAGRLNAADIALADSSTLTGNGTIRFTNLTLANGMVHADIAASNTITLSSTMPTYTSGSGGFLKTGQGELRFNGAGAFGDSNITQIDEGTVRITGFTTGTTSTIPATLQPLSRGGDYLFVPSTTYAITDFGGYVVAPDPNVYIVAGVATVPITGGFYDSSTLPPVVIPDCTVTIGGVETYIPSSTVSYPSATYGFATITGTVIGNFVLIPAQSVTVPTYFMAASTVTQNMVLNGGTIAFATTGAAASAASGGNDSIAANWLGIRFIQGDGAASSIITGSNDLIHINSGTFVPQLTGGLHVAIDAGPDGVTVLANNNTFTGVVVAESGILQVTAPSQIGSTKAANQVQIATNGGAVEFVNSMTFAGDIAVRAPTNTVIVDDGAFVQFGRIYRDATLTPGNTAVIDDTPGALNSGIVPFGGAAFVKAGSGTMTVTGAFQATGLEVDGGRYIVTSSNGLPSSNGPVSVLDGAVVQISQALATGTVSLGFSPGVGNVNPSISGTINAALCGSGTVEINQNQIVLTNAKSTIGHLNITGPGTIVASQATSLSPDGTITVDQGAALVLAASNQTLGNVVLGSGAQMSFLQTTFAVATGTSLDDAINNVLNGHVAVSPPSRIATIASLSSIGSSVPNLWFNSVISYNSADQLTINAPVSGTFKININDYSVAFGLPAPNARVDLSLIDSPAPATASSGTFIIGTPTIDIGLYKYTVTGTNTTANGRDTYSVNITGNGNMSRTAAAIYTAAAMLPISWFSELDSVTQRIGDLHLENRGNKAGFAAWTRGYGEQLNFNSNLTGTKFNERHLGGEAGLDYKFGGERSLYVGAFMGYGQSQRDYSSSTDASNQSTFGGLYATLVLPESGWYADVVAKLNTFRNQYTVTDPSSNQPLSADYKTKALGGSLELGRRVSINYEGAEAWFVTPMVQAACTNVPGKSYTTTNDVNVSVASASTTLVRAGFQFGRDFETPGDGLFSFYLKGYYGYQWTSGGAVTIALPSAAYDPNASAKFASKINGPNLTGGAGIAWRFSKATQFYLDYETTQAEYFIRPYGLNFGLRHLW